MNKILSTIVFCVALATTSFSQSTSKQLVNHDYVAALNRMMESGGSAGAFDSAIKTMVEQQKTLYPEISPAMWDRLEQEFLKVGIKELTVKLAPVYAEYLSIDDLNKITDFYQSPVGKKLADATPMITTNSMKVGQEWGYEIGMKIADEVRQEQKALEAN